MPHPEQEHALMIEVARLRRECDALHMRAVSAEKRADRNAREVTETLDALSKATDRTVAAQEALAAARRECEELRAELPDESIRDELLRADKALAAVQRECGLLRRLLVDAADLSTRCRVGQCKHVKSRGGAQDYRQCLLAVSTVLAQECEGPSVALQELLRRHEAWVNDGSHGVMGMVQILVNGIRAALAAPAAGEEGDPVIEEVPPHLCGGNNCEECGGPGAEHTDTCSCKEKSNG